MDNYNFLKSTHGKYIMYLIESLDKFEKQTNEMFNSRTFKLQSLLTNKKGFKIEVNDGLLILKNRINDYIEEKKEDKDELNKISEEIDSLVNFTISRSKEYKKKYVDNNSN